MFRVKDVKGVEYKFVLNSFYSYLVLSKIRIQNYNTVFKNGTNYGKVENTKVVRLVVVKVFVFRLKKPKTFRAPPTEAFMFWSKFWEGVKWKPRSSVK